VIQQLNQARWAIARLLFIVYIGFSIVSLVGGFLTAPLMTWYFFGDWRFWRHWSAGLGLLPHGLRLLRLMASDGQAFMFSVPLTSPPRTSPDLDATSLHPLWPQGESCGDCSKCCKAGGYTCPLLDESVGLCRGYDSFYWRYFNCGRFPSLATEIDYYDCRKWVLVPAVSPIKPPGTVSPIIHFDDLAPHQPAVAFKDLLKHLQQRQADKSSEAEGEQALQAQAVVPPSNKSSGAWSSGKGA
jgi:hypothetical protein